MDGLGKEEKGGGHFRTNQVLFKEWASVCTHTSSRYTGSDIGSYWILRDSSKHDLLDNVLRRQEDHLKETARSHCHIKWYSRLLTLDPSPTWKSHAISSLHVTHLPITKGTENLLVAQNSLCEDELCASFDAYSLKKSTVITFIGSESIPVTAYRDAQAIPLFISSCTNQKT